VEGQWFVEIVGRERECAVTKIYGEDQIVAAKVNTEEEKQY
jgi:hypothetical protein